MGIAVLTTLSSRYKSVGALAVNDYTPVVTVENKTVRRGQTFTVDVDLSANEGLISLRLTLDYDKSAMELINVEQGDALSSLTFTNTNTDTDLGYGILPFNFLWDGKSRDATNGNLVRLTFESVATIDVGNYPITFTYDPNNTNKDYGEPIAIDIVNSTITIIKGEFEAIYYDWDDTVLYQKDYNADDFPSYGGVTPTRETDIYYSYAFSGWKGIVSEDVKVLKYQAVYELTPVIYQIFYYVDGFNEDSFDGVVTEDDFYEAVEVGYGTLLDNSDPIKNRYVFSGWFTDDKCTVPFVETHMPARDLSLYGYFVYDIRTTPVPKIQLSMVENDDNTLTVYANMVANTGFNAMVLTLKHDRSVLVFTGFERKDVFSSLQFDTTNPYTEEGYNIDNFKFYYEHTENTYETGLFLVLNFKINDNSKVGVYDISFEVGNTDATYINGSNGSRYTKIDVVGIHVPVGKIYAWEGNTENDALITIRCEKGMPADTLLKVALVPESKHQINNDVIKKLAGDDMELKTVYSLKLVRLIDNVEIEVQPESPLTIEIKLTATQESCKKIALFYVNDDNEISSHQNEREGDVLRFETDHLSWWAIAGDKITVNGKLSPSIILFIILSILLAIATMAYTLILIGKNRKKKGEGNK